MFILVFGFGMNEKKFEIEIKIFNAIINETIPIIHRAQCAMHLEAEEEEGEEESDGYILKA